VSAATGPAAPPTPVPAVQEAATPPSAGDVVVTEPVPAAVRTVPGTDWVPPAAAAGGLGALALTGWVVTRKRGARSRV
jgi:hypothetical protein